MLRIFRGLTLFFIAVIIPVLALIAASPYSEAAHRASLAIIRPVHWLWTVGQMASTRHPGCPMSEVWGIVRSAPARSPIAHQILREDGELQLVRVPSGEFWSPKRDLPTVLEMAGEQERETYGQAVSVGAGDVVLDVGANIGMYTRHALARGAAKVVAIEPNLELVECLRRNFAAEIARGAVVVYPKGLWDRDETLKMSAGTKLASTANSVVIDRGASGPQIELTTMDRMATELALDRVSFIKMDIEGAEAKALTGGRETIRRHRPRMAIVLEHFLSDSVVLPALVRQIEPTLTQSFSSSCLIIEGKMVPEVLFVR